MIQARRSLAVLLSAAGASMSAGAGYMYLGGDSHRVPQPLPQPPAIESSPQTNETDANTSGVSRRRPFRAISKKDLGWEQSLARDLACWISSASVYTATQVFYATAPSAADVLRRLHTVTRPESSSSSEPLHQKLITSSAATVDVSTPGPIHTSTSTSSMYHHLIGWIQDLDPHAPNWNANNVIQSSSFNLLLNIVSGIDNLSLRRDLEQELYRAVGLLATNDQCVHAIVQRATRYGKHALLNLAQAHHVDPRMGEALSKMVHTNSSGTTKFGPANLMSLLALAVADDIPDQYLEFALWGLRTAASPTSRSKTYEWRKTLFGDDAAAKTKRKLVANERLWHTLAQVKTRPVHVQVQAAQLLRDLSANPTQIAPMLKRHLGLLESMAQWIHSDDPVLASAALQTIANVAAVDRGLRHHLLAFNALDHVRQRVLQETKPDPQVTVSLLRAVRSLATSTSASDDYVLDRDSLSFVHDTEDGEHPLHHDDFVQPHAVNSHRYVDGWIELFSTFLHSDNDDVRAEAALCLEQLASHGTHQDQGIQEWLIAVLDGVLQQVPATIATTSTTVRAAKSRTRPIIGRRADADGVASSHAKALRALAFVAGHKDCQDEFARRGGVALVKRLLSSENVAVQREAARVLANLFTCDDMHASVADFASNDDQLTTVLDKWTRSSDTMLSSLAHRARSNRRYQHNRLQHADESDVKYLDGVHPLHFSTSPAFNTGNQGSGTSDNESINDYDVDVVFIHGLLGCPYETWICGEDESTSWAQEWLLEDLQRDGRKPRILSIGYDSQLLASESSWRTMGMKETSQDILDKLHAARVGTSGRPVVFVTHSLGGLVLKQVLLESTQSNCTSTEDVPVQLMDSVNGVVFYGVPHHGSPIAQTIQAFRPRTLGIEQHPVTEDLHGTPHLKMLNDWCAAAFKEKAIPAISIGESVPCRLPLIGVDALVVPQASANPGFGEFVSVENADHIDVCKPRSKSDLRYTLTKDFITKHVPVTSDDGSMLTVD